MYEGIGIDIPDEDGTAFLLHLLQFSCGVVVAVRIEVYRDGHLLTKLDPLGRFGKSTPSDSDQTKRFVCPPTTIQLKKPWALNFAHR